MPKAMAKRKGNKWRWALQLIENAKTKAQACEYLSGWARQDGYIGGRVVYRPDEGVWKAQGFMKDAAAEWYPDGVRRVVVPPYMWNEIKKRGAGCPRGKIRS